MGCHPSHRLICFKMLIAPPVNQGCSNDGIPVPGDASGRLGCPGKDIAPGVSKDEYPAITNSCFKDSWIYHIWILFPWILKH